MSRPVSQSTRALSWTRARSTPPCSIWTGVVTRTATLHAATWRKLFDAFLRRRAETKGEAVPALRRGAATSRTYVDGKPRHEGIRSFLASRGVTLPEGQPDDRADRETVFGLGARKNQMFRQALGRSGVEVFESSLELIRRLREAGLKTAAVTSSKNAAAVIEAAGLADLFRRMCRRCRSGAPGAERQARAGHLRVRRPAPRRRRQARHRGGGCDRRRGGDPGRGLRPRRRRRSSRAGRRPAPARRLARRAGSGGAADRPGGAGRTHGPARRPPAAAPEWLLVEEGFTLTREHELESIFAIGNGHLGSRGSLAEGSGMSLARHFRSRSLRCAAGSDARPCHPAGLGEALHDHRGPASPTGYGQDPQAPPDARHAAGDSLARVATRGRRRSDHPTAGAASCLPGRPAPPDPVGCGGARELQRDRKPGRSSR